MECELNIGMKKWHFLLAILGIWCIVCPVTEFSTTNQRSVR